MLLIVYFTREKAPAPGRDDCVRRYHLPSFRNHVSCTRSSYLSVSFCLSAGLNVRLLSPYWSSSLFVARAEGPVMFVAAMCIRPQRRRLFAALREWYQSTLQRHLGKYVSIFSVFLVPVRPCTITSRICSLVVVTCVFSRFFFTCNGCCLPSFCLRGAGCSFTRQSTLGLVSPSSFPS